MTPAERAVIDAARALVASWPPERDDWAAPLVRALPRPLSEQLAELRPGAVVAAMAGGETGAFLEGEVLANRPERQEIWFKSGAYWAGVMPYRDIRRIISNPEADRG